MQRKNHKSAPTVQRTGGIRPAIIVFSWLWPFSLVDSYLAPPAAGTRAVETVEKVPSQKIIFENGTKTFWRVLSLLWEIFMNIFQAKGISTVSLGGF
jgi:hypothetical protein